jgi:perosamine synthetase
VLARSELHRLADFVARRRAVAARFDELLARRDRYTLPRLAAGTRPAWYKYPLLLPLGVDRDAVRAQLLQQHGIECGALYSPPAHLMPVFRGASPPRLPVAEAFCARQLCLPMHAALQVADADRAVAALDEVVGQYFR